MSDEPVYLDHNATTPVAPEAAEAMWPYLTDLFGNPSGATPQAARARAAVDRAREQLAALIGARPDEIIFTSGGTESNNLAIRGSAPDARTPVVVTSPVEHPATQAPVEHLRRQHGWTVTEVPVDAAARIRLDRMPGGPLGLGTLILAHNETGTLQPMRAFADAVHARGGVVHADGAQAVGKIGVSVDDLTVDLLSIAGHKFYGPKGVGALYIRRGTPVAPVLLGAGQEHGMRPGTENVAGIVGLGEAAELAGSLLESEPVRQERLRERLWSLLVREIPEIVRITPSESTLPNTLMVAVPGMLGADVLAAAHTVAASTGSACHTGVHSPSAALVATGLDETTALGALRLSLGRSTTETDIDTAASALITAARSDH
ncbi:cysteine desulfurase family protein [Rhodococcus yananensis]|uniref:cysteine desulfurase family protein n=1 Tax=Rhodococcus yananensis TaxID=2879464 RepID=UPI003EB9B24C